MAEKLHGVGIGDLEDVAGGTVEVSIDKTKIRKIAIDAKNSGKTLDWVLQFCKTEEERQYARIIWEGLS